MAPTCLKAERAAEGKQESRPKRELPNSICTVRKDRRDHKDRGSFTEGNEAVVGADLA